MSTRRKILVLALLATLVVLAFPMPAGALDLEQELLGVWAGTYLKLDTPWFSGGDRVRLEFTNRDTGLVVSLDIGSADKIPGLYPVVVEGDSFSFRIPLATVVEGQIVDGKLAGTFAPAPHSPVAT